MTIRNHLRFALSLAALAAVFSATPAAADTTDSFQVTATVIQNCSIAAAEVAIGDYDPVDANDTAPALGDGEITVRCTKGTAYTIELNAGTYAASATGGMTRAMKHSGQNEFLSYDLYTTAGYGTVWNTTNTVGATSTSRAGVNHTVYARVPGGQDALEGAYTDTVQAEVNF